MIPIVQRMGMEAINPRMSRIMPRTITPIPPRSRSACLKTASRRSWILAPFVLATDLTVHLFNGVLRFLHERVTLARLIAQFLDRATGSLRIILRMPLVSSRALQESCRFLARHLLLNGLPAHCPTSTTAAQVVRR